MSSAAPEADHDLGELGRAATFGAGDVLLVRRGAHRSWVSEGAVTKVFAIYRST
jgi:hypothetical protein